MTYPGYNGSPVAGVAKGFEQQADDLMSVIVPPPLRSLMELSDRMQDSRDKAMTRYDRAEDRQYRREDREYQREVRQNNREDRVEDRQYRREDREYQREVHQNSREDRAYVQSRRDQEAPQLEVSAENHRYNQAVRNELKRSDSPFTALVSYDGDVSILEQCAKDPRRFHEGKQLFDRMGRFYGNNQTTMDELRAHQGSGIHLVDSMADYAEKYRTGEYATKEVTLPNGVKTTVGEIFSSSSAADGLQHPMASYGFDKSVSDVVYGDDTDHASVVSLMTRPVTSSSEDPDAVPGRRGLYIDAANYLAGARGKKMVEVFGKDGASSLVNRAKRSYTDGGMVEYMEGVLAYAEMSGLSASKTDADGNVAPGDNMTDFVDRLDRTVASAKRSIFGDIKDPTLDILYTKNIIDTLKVAAENGQPVDFLKRPEVLKTIADVHNEILRARAAGSPLFFDTMMNGGSFTEEYKTLLQARLAGAPEPPESVTVRQRDLRSALLTKFSDPLGVRTPNRNTARVSLSEDSSEFLGYNSPSRVVDGMTVSLVQSVMKVAEPGIARNMRGDEALADALLGGDQESRGRAVRAIADGLAKWLPPGPSGRNFANVLATAVKADLLDDSPEGSSNFALRQIISSIALANDASIIDQIPGTENLTAKQKHDAKRVAEIFYLDNICRDQYSDEFDEYRDKIKRFAISDMGGHLPESDAVSLASRVTQQARHMMRTGDVVGAKQLLKDFSTYGIDYQYDYIQERDKNNQPLFNQDGSPVYKLSKDGKTPETQLIGPELPGANRNALKFPSVSRVSRNLKDVVSSPAAMQEYNKRRELYIRRLSYEDKLMKKQISGQD